MATKSSNTTASSAETTAEPTVDTTVETTTTEELNTELELDETEQALVSELLNATGGGENTSVDTSTDTSGTTGEGAVEGGEVVTEDNNTEPNPDPVDPNPLPDPEPEPEVIPPAIIEPVAPQVPALEASLFAQLDQYLTAMAPNQPVSEEVGKMHQLSLYNIFMAILKAQPSESFAMLTRLLKVINENRKGAFYEVYAYRFMASVVLNDAQRRTFERLMALFTETCDPKTRAQKMKHIDISYHVQFMTDVDAIENLQNYYTE